MTLEAPPLSGLHKPGKVQTIAVLTLASGIVNILWMLTLGFFTTLFGFMSFGLSCLLLPLIILPMILGVFEIIYAAKLLPAPIKPVKPSQAIAILEILCALTGNVIPVAAGVVALILYSDPEVKDYFARHAPLPVGVPSAPAPEPVITEPAAPPVLPQPESPRKLADTIVPAAEATSAPATTVERLPPAVEPAATMMAMEAVTLPAMEPVAPRVTATSAAQAKPVKAAAKPRPAAKKPAAATKAKAGKPAQGPKPRATSAKPKPKPARPKTKKPAS